MKSISMSSLLSLLVATSRSVAGFSPAATRAARFGAVRVSSCFHGSDLAMFPKKLRCVFAIAAAPERYDLSVAFCCAVLPFVLSSRSLCFLLHSFFLLVRYTDTIQHGLPHSPFCLSLSHPLHFLYDRRSRTDIRDRPVYVGGSDAV